MSLERRREVITIDVAEDYNDSPIWAVQGEHNSLELDIRVLQKGKLIDLSNTKFIFKARRTDGYVERVELVTSAALNDLNSRLIETEGAISGLPHIPATYLTNAITDSGARTITVSAADHGCGSFPIVQVYAGNEVVNANITVDIATNSDVTVTWEIVPSASTPIRVRILG